MLYRHARTIAGRLGGAGALAACLALAGCVAYVPPAQTVTVEVVDEPVDFETSLAPYGTWVATTTCGRVWRPHGHVVGAGFMPYHTGGEWVYTDQGWSFETDWEWGWAVYHYGRWCPDPGEGWVWVPGTVWAPAWVEWRTGGGYIGWAPLLPVGVVVTHTHVHTHWVFVEARHFHGGHHVHHALPPERRREVYESAQPVHRVIKHESVSWSGGPDAVEVERETGHKVRPGARVVPPKPGTVRPTTVRPVKKAPPAVRVTPPRGPRGK